jgi:hypothetical protein
MDYSQNSVGNCCGAWCVTRYLCIKGKDWDSSDVVFKKEGEKIWSEVKFKSSDGAPPDWVREQYSDPWKMIDKLGGTSALHIELAAEGTAIPEHKGLLSILKGLTSNNGRSPGKKNISGLPKGGYAIAVMHDGSGLHYLLVNRPGADSDFEIYDPRDEHLNWTTQKTFSYLSPVATKPKGSAEQHYTFLGVFIEIK